jgi:hypothetical protein
MTNNHPTSSQSEVGVVVLGVEQDEGLLALTEADVQGNQPFPKDMQQQLVAEVDEEKLKHPLEEEEEEGQSQQQQQQQQQQQHVPHHPSTHTLPRQVPQVPNTTTTIRTTPTSD